MLMPVLMQCRAFLPSRAVRTLWTFLLEETSGRDGPRSQGRPCGTSAGPKPACTLLTEAVEVFNGWVPGDPSFALDKLGVPLSVPQQQGVRVSKPKLQPWSFLPNRWLNSQHLPSPPLFCSSRCWVLTPAVSKPQHFGC